MSSAFIFMLLIGVGVGVVMVVLGDVIFKLVFDDPKISFYPFGLMSVATGIFQALSKVYNSVLQSRERVSLFLRSNLFQFTLIAALTIGGLYIYPQTLIGPMGGRLLASGIVAIWVMYRIFKEFGIQFNYGLLKSTFGFNHYAFIHQVQQWAINYFDRFLMVFFLPLSSIGIYDFALKCLLAIEFLLNSLHNSFYPKVVSVITAQTTKSTTPELNRYYYGLTAVVMIMVSGSILVLPLVLEFFKESKGYEQAIQYFPYIAVTYLFRTMRHYFAVPYGILKYTKPLPVISFGIAAFKIGLMVLLIKEYEIYGVIVSTLVSAGIEICFLKFVLEKRFRFQFNVFKILIAPLLLMAVVIILEPLFSETYPLLLHAFYVLVTGGFLLWVYRNELKLIKIPGLSR